ncbi:MAG: HAMP domain-containing histidine kinase [Thermoleophilia bacterium]|nr:HAMP domain-containing histidine kinase [Thermoleophilia bacterium]
MNLRSRITLATALVVAFVVLASSVAIYTAIRSELRGTVESQLRQIANDQGSEGRRTPMFGVPGAGRRDFGGARGFVQYLDDSGDLQRTEDSRARNDSDDALPVTRAAQRIARRGVGANLSDATVDGTHVLVFTNAITGGGALQVARPLDESDKVLHWTLIALAIISAIGVVLAGIIGRLVAGFALRPVEQFTSQAEAIASGVDERRRLDEHGSDEIARLATSFNATLDELERSMHAQRQLIADAGHELRTPIASVRANVQVLEEADRLPPEELASLRHDIVTELDELTELLADVIELARGSDPQAPQDDVRLDSLVAVAAQRAERRGDSTVSFHYDMEPTVVRGDSARIGRAITNIVDNARKWSPEHGVIDVTVRDGMIRVRDRGPGIPAADLPYVFDRFYRSDSACSMPGSGLGLAIVLQTVHAHHGTVTVTNDPAGGAVFELAFGPSHVPPAATVDDPDA